ncbi:hypothetical protein HELRODRAFT_173819 [Helobdella robusta]|uniref:Uncharacterized protein n=1 Tax=Helobdella robusta TaxID=6412 RepID=T1F799_HELRO|nr:hypothetical protein HELRODRAFT_173819 [Helobdella robusta]ESO02984.1 hypothetical protein HELRODRAFT_173819 [Helobdella robusta]
MVTLPELKHLSIDLENELYKQYNSTNQIYQQHYLKLLNILKISSDKVLNGEESPISLVKKARCMSDDLLNNIDTTYKHDQHVYDINCQVCNPSRNINKNSETVGSKLNPTKSSFKLPDETLSSNVSDVNCAFNAFPSDVSSTTDIEKPKTKEAFEDELILKSKKNENDGSFNNRFIKCIALAFWNSPRISQVDRHDINKNKMCTKECPFYGPNSELYQQVDSLAMGFPLEESLKDSKIPNYQ